MIGETYGSRKVQVKVTFKDKLTMTAVPELYLGLQLSKDGTYHYLKTLQELWGPNILPTLQNPFDVELALKAGQTEFKYLVPHQSIRDD